MNAYAALFICVAGALLLKALERAYFHLPKKELKRNAIVSKPAFRKLQMVSKYGLTARLFLAPAGFVFGASAVIISSRIFDPFIALGALAVLLALLKIASSKGFGPINKLAAAIAPYLAKPLYYIDPLVRFINSLIPGRHKPYPSTRIYETEDLEDLIKLQQKAPNNRIAQNELSSALKALEFGAKQIKDHMVARDKLHFVSPKDPIGPILLSELHKTGFACFPVQGNSDNEIAGMLYLEDLAGYTKGGMVGDAMEQKVVYIREDKPLEEVLQAFSKTGRHDFMVLDPQAQITGMVNLKDVLEQMIGHSVKTDFEDYDDPSAVTAE